ncbi:MAG: hypothetical protein NZ958_02335 [Bacteroidia bacterium]|nr:hypothetical protein [Bacteroidia bacterium]MDW8089183.1 hypothetical protein [Bacteroidia bacterium]
MKELKALEDLLVPVPETEVRAVLERYQSFLCMELQALGSLLYVAEPSESDPTFRFEAGAGLVGSPTPERFRKGEGWLGQASTAKHPLTFRLPLAQLLKPSLSAIVEVEETYLTAVPLFFQDRLQALWVVVSEKSDLESILAQPEWHEVLYKWSAYLQSLRAQRYIQALLEQAQVQNQELITREEELRQNLEELATTQEEMRRTQALLARQTELQNFVIDTFTLLSTANTFRFRSVSRIFLAQVSQYLGAEAAVVLSPQQDSWQALGFWKSRKYSEELPVEWPIASEILRALSEARTCLAYPGPQIGPPHLKGEWILVPYFTPNGVGGLLALSYPHPVALDDDLKRALLHIGTAYFSSYERVKGSAREIKGWLTQIAHTSGASIQAVALSELGNGALPWLSEIPLVQREAYLASLNEALQQKAIIWQPPAGVASREIGFFLLGDFIRLRWE